MRKILHIMSDFSGYNKKYLEFINNHFNSQCHIFVFLSRANRVNSHNILTVDRKKKVIKLLNLMKNSDRIVIHGLFSKYLLLLLCLFPIFLKKSSWVLWGGDLYYYKFRSKTFKSNVYEMIRRKVISNLDQVIALVQGDYELVKKWYKTRAIYQYSFYPNLINYDYLEKIKTNYNHSDTVTFQIGNSADPSNKQIEILEILSRHKSKNIEIVCPLSYGDQEWAKKVIGKGREIFGEKFRPLTEILSAEEYSQMLNSVDVAIFNHDRQQALGNILSLLYLGKKVYIKNDITTWDFLDGKGIKIFNTYEIPNLTFERLSAMDKTLGEKNAELVRNHFSEEKCVALWQNIFDS